MWFIKNIAYCARAVIQIRMFSKRSQDLELYGDVISPPVRFVQMTSAMLGVSLKMNNVDLFKGENRSDGFLKLNPLGKVPVLKLDNVRIADSHAIGLYLCENFGGRLLYPAEPAARAMVQQLMFFNCSTLFPIDSAVYTEYFAGVQPMAENHKFQWNSALNYLELFLAETEWLAGGQMTLCDLCCGATVSSLELLMPTAENYTNVNRWISNLNKLPCNAVNTIGIEKLRGYINKYKVDM